MTNTRRVIIKLPALLQNLALLDAPVTRLLSHPCELEIGEAEILNARRVVRELCGNIIRHAYQGDRGVITLILELDPFSGRFSVISQDKGRYRLEPGVWGPRIVDSVTAPGTGVRLLTQLMDEVKYEPAPDQNQWVLVKTFARRPQAAGIQSGRLPLDSASAAAEIGSPC